MPPAVINVVEEALKIFYYPSPTGMLILPEWGLLVGLAAVQKCHTWQTFTGFKNTDDRCNYYKSQRSPCNNSPVKIGLSCLM